MERLSRIFWPVLVTPKNAVVKHVEAISRSQKLMAELGLVKPAHNGTFQIMPLAQRALDKCIALVQQRMRAIGGQQISLPVLTSAELWQKSGRLEGDISEFYMVRDRHGKQFLLSPTHEEAITAMLAAAAPISYRQLPLRLYQVGPKFRDELKPRFGLLRAKEFIMKDMYTFNRTLGEAHDAYEQVCEAYETLYQQLEVPFAKVKAATGMMGGSTSHEFHYLSASGEDHLLLCADCGYAANDEVATEVGTNNCPHCKSSNIQHVCGIEVGHTFLLGDKYSRPLSATFLQENGKPTPLIMGCYGIGITRLVAAALEVLSSETELRWPTLLAPYDVCVIGPKQGSKEQQIGDNVEMDICHSLTSVCQGEQLLLDDRKYLTIGKRLMDAKRMGYPLILVVGSKATLQVPKIELHMGDTKMELEPAEVLFEVAKYMERKQQLLTMERKAFKNGDKPVAVAHK